MRDREFLGWAHRLPCWVRVWYAQLCDEALNCPDEIKRADMLADLPPRELVNCMGAIEADHMGPRPLGRKSDDRDIGILCTRHHAMRHSFNGLFKGWDRERMAEFKHQAVAWVQRMYEQEFGSLPHKKAEVAS